MGGERRHYEFSGYRLDTVAQQLFGADGAAIAVKGKALEVLAYLIERRDRVVDKDDLLGAVWAGRVVEENNLTQAISALRKAFGIRPQEHRFIVTVSGRGYRFVAPVEVVDGLPGATGPATRGRVALAVLPFRPLSNGPRDEMLETGLADTLITQLSRVEQLRVRALASAERVNPDALRNPEVAGRQLGAAYVVDGSTQRINGRVRVNARLLSVSDNAIVWADTVDTDMDNLFAFQDKMSAAVLTALSLPAAAMPRYAATARDPGAPDAYRAWLHGLHLLQRPDVANLGKALAAFQDAIDLDVSCTRAYAGMALAWRGLVHLDHEPREMFTLAKAAVAKALKIDPDSPEALVAEGRNLQLFDWDWARSEASLQRAIELSPSLMDAHFAYAHLLVNLGRFDEGLEQARQARELDPLSPMVNAVYAGLLTAAGQGEAAHMQVRRALELKPGFWLALQVRGAMALERGDARAAIADLELAVEGSGHASQIVALLAVACVGAGEQARAQAILHELEARRAAGYVLPTSIAAVHAALGNVDAAMQELERAYRERDVRLVFLKVDARWNPLRRHAQFRSLGRRMGLESARGLSCL